MALSPSCPCVRRGGGTCSQELADLARLAVGGRLPEPAAAVVPVVGVHVQQADVGQSPTVRLRRGELARGPFSSSNQFFTAKMPARPRPSSAELKLPRTQALIRRQPAASGPRAEPHAQTAGGPSPSRRNPPASRRIKAPAQAGTGPAQQRRPLTCRERPPRCGRPASLGGPAPRRRPLKTAAFIAVEALSCLSKSWECETAAAAPSRPD